MVGFMIRWVGAIGLLIASAVFLSYAGGATAQAPSSIEVHVSACPTGVGDRTLFDACHANGITGDEIVLDGPVRTSAVTTGELGTVRFENLPGGEYTIAEAVMTGAYSEYQVYCSDTAGGIRVDYRGNGRAAVAITLAEGAQVVCDWYNIPPQESGVTPTSTPAETPVTTFPDVGTGPTGGHRILTLDTILLLAASALLVAAGYQLSGNRRDIDTRRALYRNR